MLTLLRRVLKILALCVAVIVVGFVVAVSLGIRVDLEPLRTPFETIASQALGREVRLEGDIFLVPTWSVTVEANGMHIANPPGFGGDEFAKLRLARLQVRVLPLLRRRVVIRELRAEGIQVFFERRADGSSNWEFAPGEAEPDGTDEAGAEDADDEPLDWRALLPSAVVLEELALHDIRAVVQDELLGTTREAVLERLDGAAATDAPLELSMAGAYHGHRFEASLHGGDTSFLIGGDQPWPLRSELEVAGTRITLSAQVDEREWDFTDTLKLLLESTRHPLAGLEGQRLGEITVTVEGERLDALDELLEVSLPHWGPHRFEGRFEAFGGGSLTAEVVTRVGESELTGTLRIESGADPPRVELDLEAASIQLDDFRLEGWSALDAPAEAAAPGDEAAPGEPAAPPRQDRALLSPEVMGMLDAKLEVRVAKVAAGRDWLGKGRLAARLEGGRFKLDAFDIAVPGGSIVTRASLTPRQRSISGTLHLVIDRFDYGILARRLAPESDMSGLFAVEIELASTAPDADSFLKHASGHFDAAVFPEKLEAGVIDLWAVNLVAAVLPEIDSSEQSKVNCFVMLMDMKDGIMEQRALLVDTSRLTVHGKAKVDFHEEKVVVELAPTPKKPEFFSVATPVRVEGDFEDFDIDLPPGELMLTLVRFATSVVHVPVRRLFQLGQDPGKLDTCMAALKDR